MNSFIKNFRQTEVPIKPGPHIGVDANGNFTGSSGRVRNIYAPDALGNDNEASYRERVVVPFSYEDSDGDTQYGIVHIPKYEQKYFEHGSQRKGENIATYGAELMNGMGLSVKGFSEFYDDHKNDIEFLSNAFFEGSNNSPSNGDKGRSITAKNGEFYNNLRKSLGKLQLDAGFGKVWDKNKLNQNTYKSSPAYRNFLMDNKNLIDLTGDSFYQDDYNKIVGGQK